MCGIVYPLRLFGLPLKPFSILVSCEGKDNHGFQSCCHIQNNLIAMFDPRKHLLLCLVNFLDNIETADYKILASLHGRYLAFCKHALSSRDATQLSFPLSFQVNFKHGEIRYLYSLLAKFMQ